MNRLLLLFLTGLWACTSPMEVPDREETGTAYYLQNRSPLKARPFLELPLGAIQAQGWLKGQLETMATGLTGNLDKVYPEVVGQRNGWLGGDGDGWERGPYWIDGLLPLAYILDEDSLKAQVQPWIEWTLQSQTESGYFGPVPFEEEPEAEPGLQKTPRRDWWPKMVMLKILQQYYGATQDQRVLELLSRYFRFQLSELSQTPLDHWSLWANRRGGDNLMVVYWLYNLTGDAYLLELASLLHEQTFPWTEVFAHDDCYDLRHTPWYYQQVKRYPFERAEMDNLCIKQMGSFHTVNLAQGIKEPIIYFQQALDSSYYHAVKKAFRDLDKYHGQAQGMYGGDEPLHGNDPTRGVEFCSVVEMMFSLEKMLTITGDLSFADRLERIAYNALPAQASDDFQTRQYFQAANQVEISRGKRNFYQDMGHKETDNCFGTLTGYPCCTCNMHQGWPKFVQNLWYATPDRGVAKLLYGPSQVTLQVGHEVEVEIIEKGAYPFMDTVSFEVKSPEPVHFPWTFRVPGWCNSGTVFVNGELVGQGEENSLLRIERKWEHGDQVELILPLEVQTRRWYDFSLAVERGPLVYSLKIPEKWEFVANPDKYGDFYEVYPLAPWNYALIETEAGQLNTFTLEYTPIKPGENPWNLEHAPLHIQTQGTRIPEWTATRGLMGPLPWATRNPDPRFHLPETIELVPYGCTTLRITQFPTVRVGGS